MVLHSEISSIAKILADVEQPMKKRFRALFTLRSIGGRASIDAISACFTDSSALLKHELAYCLGQMGDTTAIPILSQVLEDVNQEPMVRHEAGEALGAIGDESVLPLLKKYSQDIVPEVSETCQLALARMQWVKNIDKVNSMDRPIVSTSNKFKSIDPTPPSQETCIKTLQNTLLNEEVLLYDRYCAMFSLRNIDTSESALALSKGLNSSSALFRHEIGFVLGQMSNENPEVVTRLQKVVEDRNENEMVRHEAAEALGSIATKEAINVLVKYVNDDVRVLRESCEVALDIAEYQTNESFQYADGLHKVTKDEKN